MRNQAYQYTPQTRTDEGGPYSGGTWDNPTGSSQGTSGGGLTPGGGFTSTSSSSSSGSVTGGFVPGGGFQEVSDFPEWLQEPDMHELESEYENLDFNIRPMIRPIRNLANAQYSNALQQGANAADEAIARAFQTGIVGPINTSMISAQTAMPALLAKLGAEKDIAGLKIQNMYKEQEARAALAAQIAAMRQSYVNTMATYALGEDKLALEGALGFGQLDMQQQQLDFAQQQYQDRQDAGVSYDELATIMSSFNSAIGEPSALNYWQQFGAGLGGFGGENVGISFGGSAAAGAPTGGPSPSDYSWLQLLA